MFKKLRRAACAVCAVVVMAAVSVSAAADDYTYAMDNKKLCDEIRADNQNINGSEGTFTTKFGDSTGEDFFSLRFRLFNKYADLDFWNDDSVSVSIDVKLETEGKDVIGCLPAFTTNWSWVNPSDYISLKYGEWVTVTESGKHFYDGFSGKKPAYIMIQVRTNWGAAAQGDVKLSVRNFRISSSGAAVTEPEETTTSATTADTTTSATTAVPTEEPAEVTTSEQAVTAENTAEPSTADNGTVDSSETKEAAVTEPEQTTSAPADTSAPQTEPTTINVPEMEGEQPETYTDLYQHESPVMLIVIIVGAAAVISIGAVVGYIIYKKKKYY